MVLRNEDINWEAAHILILSAQPLVSSNTSSPCDWSKANSAELNYIAIFSIFESLFMVHFIHNLFRIYISTFIDVFKAYNIYTNTGILAKFLSWAWGLFSVFRVRYVPPI